MEVKTLQDKKFAIYIAVSDNGIIYTQLRETAQTSNSSVQESNCIYGPALCAIVGFAEPR